MMGSTHALNGAVAGAVLAPALGHGPLTTAVYITITAGAALVPDLDHTNSTATLAHGGVTKAISSDLRDLSAKVWSKSATRYDRMSAEHSHDVKGTHRYLTHTAIFAVVFGGIIGIMSGFSPFRWVATALMISFAIRGFCQMWPNKDLDAWPLRTGVALAVAWPIVFGIGTAGPMIDWKELWLMITIGCLTHDGADMLTKAKVPFLWPIMIRGMRWRRIGWALASTGHGWFEIGLRWASVAGTVVITLWTQ